MVKPGAVELVLDIRREYATKLEEVIIHSLGFMLEICEESMVAITISLEEDQAVLTRMLAIYVKI